MCIKVVMTACVHFPAFPDVTELTLTPDLEFLVLACDGIWDVLTNQEVVDFIRCRIVQRMEPEIVRIITLFRIGSPWC